MTPDEAQYYLLMLRLGEYAEYDKALDRLLLEQDPLSPLVLELAFCMSDRRQTISILHNFLLDHPADEEQLMNQQLDWVREQYREKAMTAIQAAAYLSRAYHTKSGTEPWWELWQYLDDYDLYTDGTIYAGRTYKTPAPKPGDSGGPAPPGAGRELRHIRHTRPCGA